MIIVKPDIYSTNGVACVYQLHGYSDDSTQWSRMTSIERFAIDRNIMVVMPDGGKGFYTNAINGDSYEDHILETVNFVDKNFNTIKDKSARAIGGLSMGGYGAMKIGLKHVDIFSSIAAHSSVIDPIEFRDNRSLMDIFGDTLQDGNNLYELAQKSASKTNLKFDCGIEDFLFYQNRKFHDFLSENKIPHVYNEFSGSHTWEYWNEHIIEALDFHVKNLNVKI